MRDTDANKEENDFLHYMIVEATFVRRGILPVNMTESAKCVCRVYSFCLLITEKGKIRKLKEKSYKFILVTSTYYDCNCK